MSATLSTGMAAGLPDRHSQSVLGARRQRHVSRQRTFGAVALLSGLAFALRADWLPVEAFAVWGRASSRLAGGELPGARRRRGDAELTLGAGKRREGCRCVVVRSVPDEEPERPPILLGPAAEGPKQSPEIGGQTGAVPLARVAPRKFRLLFTCKICEHRNSHMIGRLAYTQGIVVATCPGCNSRHLIADKTGILDYGIWDIEMLAAQGENVTRLGGDGFRQVLSSADEKSAVEALGTPEGKPPMLVRNKDGVIEAVIEDGISINAATEFLSEDSAEEEEEEDQGNR